MDNIEFGLPLYESTKNISKQKIVEKIEKIFDKQDIKYAISKESRKKFINNQSNIFGDVSICISLGNRKDLSKICSYINKEIKSMGAHVKRDNYGTIFLYCTEMPSENTFNLLETNFISIPNEKKPLEEILNKTDHKKIYLTSDWHFFKNRYKHEANYVNTQKILTWCRQNIKDDDVFMYLGDISFRYANDEDKKESARLMSSIPGIKVLILGNHDIICGEDYFVSCGFQYVYQQFEWNKYVFTHRPINMELYSEDKWNIHGHIHNIRSYYTTDGKRNVNVYPMWFNNKPVTLDYIEHNFDKLIKDNYHIDNVGFDESFYDYEDTILMLEEKRSELPDSSFGIPEDRKYPLDTKKHVQSAIKLFGHAEESKKKDLAYRIKNAAKKYDLRIPENTQCYKYLTESGIDDIIPDGINNIIFDFGNVLIGDNLHHEIMTRLAISDIRAHEIYDYLYDIFLSDTYDKKIDLESIKEFKYRLCNDKNTPEDIKMHIDEILEAMVNSTYVYSYTYELLTTLKDKGYSIYYLSNWTRSSYELKKDFFKPILEKFDGGLFSFEDPYYMKPQQDFYKHLLNKYYLDPSTCLFFDDKSENIIAAESVGIKGIVFDVNETPKLLLNNNFNIPSDINNKLIINTGVKLETTNLNNISWWYISNKLKNNHPDEELYFKTIESAIQQYCLNNSYTAENNTMNNYVFTCNGDKGDLTPILVGQIEIFNDGSYNWTVQYPIEYIDGLYKSSLKEWSMASYNPIVGIHKPFILKVTPDNKSNISPSQYVLSPDIISDKYLAVNENAKLEIIDASKFKDCYIEVYEFIGDSNMINKLAKAYYEEKTVDNTIFYTALTGKVMLCEDQIDFDNNFKKIDLELFAYKTLSELATLRDDILELTGSGIKWTSLIESEYKDKVNILNKYNIHGDISINKDLDGYYFYSNLTHKRSNSVKNLSNLTESMIKSIL